MSNSRYQRTGLVVSSVLVGAMAVVTYVGLGEGVKDQQTQPVVEAQEPQQKNEKPYFDDFGVVAKPDTIYRQINIDIRTLDMDGDGDLDIILADKPSGIVEILENRIPQKKKE